MRNLIALLGSTILIGLSSTTVSAQAGKELQPPAAAQISALSRAPPMELRASRLPGAVFNMAPVAPSRGQPQVLAGNAGPKAGRARFAGPEDTGIDTQNYGQNPFGGGGTNLNTIYHYTDKLVDVEAVDNYPHRAVGHLAFTTAANTNARCTASLIAPSILVTAGHCLHQGGTKDGRTPAQGWIKSAYFVPARTAGVQPAGPYGYATVRYINVTAAWYASGLIQQGYDVGVAVLNKRIGTTIEIGRYTGWLGVCVTNCLQPFWYLTQLGYPGNYYSGLYQYEGQHLEANRNNTDFFHGSGAQGGSSGGPHVANLGSISDSTTNKGLSQSRNVVFSVTSWGYVSDIYKIQGSSSLSGPNNTNNFKAFFNWACGKSQALHGSLSCTLLP